MLDNVLALILGGGRGDRLFPLTRERSKPAVPLAGKCRLVDVPISNCLSSGIRRIYVLTQFNSASLNNHISRTYRFDPFGPGFVDILAAELTPESREWFQGTADAVRQNFRHFESVDAVEHVLILGGDQLYRMDFSSLLEQHRDLDSEITVASTPVPAESVSRYGILRIDAERRILAFVEKPEPDALDDLKTEHGYLGSMGIYLFNREVLWQVLEDGPANDFGKDILPRAVRKRRVHAFVHHGYFEDVGTIGSFFQANLELTDTVPRFDLYDPLHPLYTRPRFLPASKLNECTVSRSLISEGCILTRCRIEHSVIGIRSRIEEGAVVQNSIIMGADSYQTAKELEADSAAGTPHVGIGGGALVVNAIIDKGARIGAAARIVNSGGVQHFDGADYYIRDGIVVVPKGVSIAPGTEI
jgi:glucose-1-phosphate adenylyltransferase